MPQPARTPTSCIWPRAVLSAEGGALSHLQAKAKHLSIGKLIDEAMAAIEVATPGLKVVLPKDHNRPALDG